MLEAEELAEDEALECGLWVGRELRNVVVFIAFLFEEEVGDAVVGVDGECDVEEVDCSR